MITLMDNNETEKQCTLPLVPSYFRSQIWSLIVAKQVSLQAGASPASDVGARKVVPGSSAVATNSTCSQQRDSSLFEPKKNSIKGLYHYTPKLLAD